MNWRLKILKGLWTPGVVCFCPGALYMYITIIFQDHLANRSQFYRKHVYEGGTNVIINKPGHHMTKMATMPIYGKNPAKIFFIGAAELIATKIDM